MEHWHAAVLFAAISGFTRLAEALSQRGPAGTDELTRALNADIGCLIDVIGEHGGDIVKFAGDALLAVWPSASGDLSVPVLRAAQCALDVQQRFRRLPEVAGFRISVRIAISAGGATGLVVGGVNGRWETVATGEALAQIAGAVHQARPGEFPGRAATWQPRRRSGKVTGMVTILGAGGAIGNELARELTARNERIRLVGRKPRTNTGAAETLAADLSQLDDTVKAVSGSTVAFLLAGLKYDLKSWRELWPRIMRNTIEAAKRAGARLVFFDNVYMYGKVDGAMTEETPFRPCSRKGEIRAEIATTLLHEIQAGRLTALIARCADFYGPGARTGVPNILVFDKLAQGRKPSWLANDSVKHSFTFTPDAARSLVQLMDSESSWNQTWHVPTAPDPPTGKEFIALAAREFGTAPKHRVLTRPMLKVAGWFDATVRESYEMLYQSEFDYVFDSSKFAREFPGQATSYAEGIRQTAEASRR